MAKYKEQAHRLRLIMVELHINSVNTFAAEIGIHQATWNKKVIGEQKLTSDQIEKLIERYPNISLNWLLSGKGEMFIDKTASPNNDNCSMEVLKIENETLKRSLRRQASEIEDLNKLIDVLRSELTKK